MTLRIGLAQINVSVGDIEGNSAKIRDFYAKGIEAGVDLIIFPEMAISGYPPEDLLLKKHFFEENMRAVERLAKDCSEKTVILGFAEMACDGYFNSLAILEKGVVKKIYRKLILPNYGVFDERRYFRPGTGSTTLSINGKVIIPTICEDIWHIEWIDKFIGEIYHKDLIVNISASPFHIGKPDRRKEVLSRCAVYFNCPVAYCNIVGGQDELVFDGRSTFLDAKGTVICQAKAFDEDLLIADVEPNKSGGIYPAHSENMAAIAAQKHIDAVSEIYQALVLGTRDYVRKNGFNKVLIGLSGGIDSSVTAAIAVDALGSENVVGVTMPSKFNTSETTRDAVEMARNLGIEFHTIPIGAVLDKFDETLYKIEGWSNSGVAYENLQARIRGVILMSLSNQFSYLVLTTGNKSENAVGYCTLYGDTAGGFAVIKDVPKTMVYKIAKHINRIRRSRTIPKSVIDRPPSAELREKQKDTDSLPEYDLLDRILASYIEEDKSILQMIDKDLPEDIVRNVTRMVDLNEYKRRQSPPGVKITPKAFGKDRRMPITNCYVSR